jgi:hypothetical protein
MKPLVNPKLEALRTMTYQLFATVVMLLKKNWQHFTQQVMVSNKFWK